jgi:hypothetical protein
VRIFEGIIGIFQDAHFSKTVRTFEPRAHLRSRALALHPVPFSRKVVQALASASIALCCVETNLIRLTSFTVLHLLRDAQDQGDPQITPTSQI